MTGLELDFYMTLRAEVVKAAVDDLKKAMRKSDRLGHVCKEQESLEKWFLSPWGQALSDDNGVEIIARCRRTYKRGSAERPLPLSDEIAKKMCALFKGGMSRAAIAEKYGTTEAIVARAWRKWGD